MTREMAIQVLQTALTSPLIYGDYAEAIDMAIEALSAEAVEVVRCRECKYAEVYDGYYTQVCCENGVIGGHGELWNPDDYCSYGERKDGEADD